MRKTLSYIGCLMIISGLIFNYKREILALYNAAVDYFNKNEISFVKNDYFREEDFLFVQNTVNFEPMNEKDIINIFYTAINSGMKSFTFYCPRDYVSCTDDVSKLANDQAKLSHINNFVHPYNSFKHIEIQYNSSGEVTLSFNRSYSSKDIEAINIKIDEIYNAIINEMSTDIEKIRIIHDYIINNSIYDSDRSDMGIINYKSDIAYGPLFEGYGICGGYSDAMQLFLEKLGIKNYKVSSENHVWNAIYLDGFWYHLDLTWDDPVTPDKSNVLNHDYFLVTTRQLLSKELTEHNFDQDIYLELKIEKTIQ